MYTEKVNLVWSNMALGRWFFQMSWSGSWAEFSKFIIMHCQEIPDSEVDYEDAAVLTSTICTGPITVHQHSNRNSLPWSGCCRHRHHKPTRAVFQSKWRGADYKVNIVVVIGLQGRCGGPLPVVKRTKGDMVVNGSYRGDVVALRRCQQRQIR